MIFRSASSGMNAAGLARDRALFVEFFRGMRSYPMLRYSTGRPSEVALLIPSVMPGEIPRSV